MRNTPHSAPATPQLAATFGPRLVTLSSGSPGLRSSLGVTSRDASEAPGEPVMDMIASDETMDRYNECIKVNGWDLDCYRRNPVVVDSHDYSSVAKIIGRSDSVEIKDNALVNRVRFALDNPLGTLCWKLAKGGFIKSESVGFIPREWTDGNDPSKPGRTFTKCELLEISLVAVPMNPGATIGAAIKSGAVTQQDVRAVVDQMRLSLEELTKLIGQDSPAADDVHAGRLAHAIGELHRILRR